MVVFFSFVMKAIIYEKKRDGGRERGRRWQWPPASCSLHSTRLQVITDTILICFLRFLYPITVMPKKLFAINTFNWSIYHTLLQMCISRISANGISLQALKTWWQDSKIKETFLLIILKHISFQRTGLEMFSYSVNIYIFLSVALKLHSCLFRQSG